MKGNEEVIECLNAGLTVELTAVNQYFIHSKMCESWDSTNWPSITTPNRLKK